MGEAVTAKSCSVSKSAVSRRFVAATESALADLMSADLSALDLPPAETARTQAPVPAPPPVAAPKATGPKLIVEDSLQAHPPAPKPGGRIAVPADPIAEAMRAAANRGTGGPRTSLGDSPELSIGAGLHMPAAAARLSNFQLKSDPMGVDFWPYLQQVLAEVKLNWAAVYPQAARLGLRGVVTVEFAVAKDGTLDKVVWDQQNGRAGAG